MRVEITYYDRWNVLIFVSRKNIDERFGLFNPLFFKGVIEVDSTNAHTMRSEVQDCFEPASPSQIDYFRCFVFGSRSDRYTNIFYVRAFSI